MFKIKDFWFAPEWEDALKSTGLFDIEAVTQRDFDWFEAPKKRRGGWSGVTRLTLNAETTSGEQQAIFLKIQQNHFYRAPSTGFTKQLSFAREFKALQALHAKTSCMPNLLLYAKWQKNKDLGAMIITESLDGWTPFDGWLSEMNQGPIDKAQREPQIQQALNSVATAARELHQSGWAHFGFFP
jgi:hypothetical protein